MSISIERESLFRTSIRAASAAAALVIGLAISTDVRSCGPFVPQTGYFGIGGVYAIAGSASGRYIYVTVGNQLRQFRREPGGNINLFPDYSVQGVFGVATSPVGNDVYATSSTEHSVTSFRLGEVSEVLMTVEVLEEGGTSSGCGPCPVITGLSGAGAVAVSKDGGNVYVLGTDDDALAVFDRSESTGKLMFRGSFKHGFGGVGGMKGPSNLAISPDDKHVYVSAYERGPVNGGTVAVFNRDTVTGSLSFSTSYADGDPGLTNLNGASGITVSPDGQHVYVVAQSDDAVTTFRRDPTSGSLTVLQSLVDGLQANGLFGANDVKVSHNGKYVFTAAFNDNAVGVFKRGGDGRLTYDSVCVDAMSGEPRLSGPRRLYMHPGGRDLYVTANLDQAVTLLQLTGAGFYDGFE